MQDVVIVDIPKMQTTTFVTTGLKNFIIVGSTSLAMLSRVPANNPIIVKYLKTAINTESYGFESIHTEEIPKKITKSSKWKDKSIVSKKTKKQNRRRLTQVVVEEVSSERTESFDRNEKEFSLNVKPLI